MNTVEVQNRFQAVEEIVTEKYEKFTSANREVTNKAFTHQKKDKRTQLPHDGSDSSTMVE